MILAHQLTKRFEDFTALRSLSCEIEKGCIYGMVGSNGAGKSTFLRLLTGVYQPMKAVFPLTENPSGIIRKSNSTLPMCRMNCIF